jgi:DNA-binding MarR family transcriptional regulator
MNCQYYGFMALDLNAPINCTSFKTRQLARLVARHFDSEMAEAGLKTTQYSLLTHVLHRGPITTKELASRMSLEISTLTRNLKPLLDQQRVRQYVGEDARTRIVAITPGGIKLQKAAHLRWQSAQKRMNETIGDSTALELHTLMNEVIFKLKGKTEEAVN